jgi:prephenate dehydrogenase
VMAEEPVLDDAEALPQLARITIIGVGMIGGSFALSLKGKGVVDEVVGYGRSRERLETAKNLGVIDRFSCDLTEAVTGADLIFLAAPIDASKRLLKELVSLVGPEVIITDVGSVKQEIISAARESLEEGLAMFIPGHPIAGKEKTGVTAADGALFVDHRVVLTPVEETNRYATQRVRRLWEIAGADVVEMDAMEHDRLLAMTSHLPHAVAFALVALLGEQQNAEEFFPLAAGGFYDLTRVASSDPVMWRDIFLNNKEPVLAGIDGYITVLERIRELIRLGNGTELEALFEHARETRARIRTGRVV